MPNQNIRVGVPQILLSIDDPTTLVPNCSSLVFTASGASPTAATNYLLNDVNSNLSTSDTYQVAIGLVGRDYANGGYTIAPTSLSSGNLTVTAGQFIKVSVPNANWPANFGEAICAAVFLKTNGGQFQIAKFAYVDPTSDFVTAIMAKPLKAVPSFTIVTLSSYAQDAAGILGSRIPYGVVYAELTPTTGAFNFRRAVSTVTISPNNGPDFPIATTRSAGVRFEVLQNDIKSIVQAAAGNYIQYIHGGVTYEEGEMSLATAQAIIKGNRSVQFLMPADSNGYQEIRLLIGNLTVNQQEITEAWSKTAPTPITFQFDPAALDKLITNQHTEIQYKRWA